MLVAGCVEQPEPASTQPPSSEGEENLSQIELPEEGLLKLGSPLPELIYAEIRGEAASFVKTRNIELSNGKVNVIIEVNPGEMEAAIEAASRAGARTGSSYKDLLEASVPIRKLAVLAAEESIRLVRLPATPLPAAAN
jgi:hypothetical protein